jgi:hypothetical protein
VHVTSHWRHFRCDVAQSTKRGVWNIPRPTPLKNKKVHCTPHKLRTLLKVADVCNGKKKQEGLGSQNLSCFTTGGLQPIVRIGDDHRAFFFQLSPFCNSSYVTSSLTRRWVCRLWICLAFRHAYVQHLQHVTKKIFPLHYTQVLCQYRRCTAYHA